MKVKDPELLKDFEMLPNQPILVFDNVSATDRGQIQSIG
jgi:hypothetical protein